MTTRGASPNRIHRHPLHRRDALRPKYNTVRRSVVIDSDWQQGGGIGAEGSTEHCRLIEIEADAVLI